MITEKFYNETDYEMECKKRTGKSFKTVQEHTDVMKNNGCAKLIDVLAEASMLD